MSELSWILGWLPTWFWSAAFLAGCAALIGSQLLQFIPIINVYKMPLQIAGIVMLLLSIWFLGAASNEEKWKQKVKVLEEKIAKNEQASGKINIVIEERVVYNTKVIKQKGDEILKYIDREVINNIEVIKFVENCPIPREIISIHNEAAQINKTVEGIKK